MAEEFALERDNLEIDKSWQQVLIRQPYLDRIRYFYMFRIIG